jgi:glycosyltransferase involved in cell wall biosynthesis
MKICLDVRYKTESGASSYIKNLVPELLKHDKSNAYIIVKYHSQSFGFEKDVERCILAPEGSDALYMLWTLLVLPIKLKLHHVDIYHTLKNPGPLWSSTKNIHTMHSLPGDYNRKKQGNFPVSYRRYLYHSVYGNYFLKKTSRVIAISDFIYEFLTNDFKMERDRIDLIYHGIGDQYKPIDEEMIKPVLGKYYLPENYMLSVGNITPVKNHISAVLAFAEISDEIGTNLVVVGGKEDPYFQKVFKAVQDNNLLKRVYFPGFIKSDDLVAVFSGAKLLLFPSLTEGCPITMLEAIKCGLPVIASKRGGLWDIGKKCALFVDDPMDYKGFAALILKLLASDALQREYREKSLKRAHDFNWETTAIKTLETYRRCYDPAIF